jgi:hypothetical protein
MHPSQFDAFSRTLADGVSRRQALTRVGAVSGSAQTPGWQRGAQHTPRLPHHASVHNGTLAASVRRCMTPRRRL